MIYTKTALKQWTPDQDQNIPNYSKKPDILDGWKIAVSPDMNQIAVLQENTLEIVNINDTPIKDCRFEIPTDSHPEFRHVVWSIDMKCILWSDSFGNISIFGTKRKKILTVINAKSSMTAPLSHLLVIQSELPNQLSVFACAVNHMFCLYKISFTINSSETYIEVIGPYILNELRGYFGCALDIAYKPSTNSIIFAYQPKSFQRTINQTLSTKNIVNSHKSIRIIEIAFGHEEPFITQLKPDLSIQKVGIHLCASVPSVMAKIGSIASSRIKSLLADQIKISLDSTKGFIIIYNHNSLIIFNQTFHHIKTVPASTLFDSASFQQIEWVATTDALIFNTKGNLVSFNIDNDRVNTLDVDVCQLSSNAVIFPNTPNMSTITCFELSNKVLQFSKVDNLLIPFHPDNNKLTSYWDYFSKTKPIDINIRKYMLFSIESIPPERYFDRLLAAEEYDNALVIAEQFDIDTDLLYKTQFLNEPNNSQILELIKDTDWVVESCANIICDTSEDMKRVLSYGLSLTSKITKAECEEYILSVLHDKSPKETLIPLDAMCRKRQEILRLLDMVQTCSAIHSTEFKRNFSILKDMNVVSLACDYASRNNFKALDILFKRYYRHLIGYRWSILQNISEGCDAILYERFLPSWENGTEAWKIDESPWRRQDWCESIEMKEFSGLKNDEELNLLGLNLECVPFPCTEAFIMEWYMRRSFDIEDIIGSPEMSFEFLKIGIAKGVPGLESTLTLMNTLAYIIGVLDPNSTQFLDMSARFLQNMSLDHVISLILFDVSPSTVVMLIHDRVYPYWNSLKQKDPLDTHIKTFLLSCSDYAIVVACLDHYFLDPTFFSAHTILQIILETVYVVPGVTLENLRELSEFIKLLGCTQDSDEDTIMFIDVFETHTACYEILISYIPTYSFRGVTFLEESSAKQLSFVKDICDKISYDGDNQKLFEDLIKLKKFGLLQYLSIEALSRMFLIECLRQQLYPISEWMIARANEDVLEVCRESVLECVEACIESANSSSKENKYLKNAKKSLEIFTSLGKADYAINRTVKLIDGIILAGAFFQSMRPVEIRHTDKIALLKQLILENSNVEVNFEFLSQLAFCFEIQTLDYIECIFASTTKFLERNDFQSCILIMDEIRLNTKHSIVFKERFAHDIIDFCIIILQKAQLLHSDADELIGFCYKIAPKHRLLEIIGTFRELRANTLCTEMRADLSSEYVDKGIERNHLLCIVEEFVEESIANGPTGDELDRAARLVIASLEMDRLLNHSFEAKSSSIIHEFQLAQLTIQEDPSQAMYSLLSLKNDSISERFFDLIDPSLSNQCLESYYLTLNAIRTIEPTLFSRFTSLSTQEAVMLVSSLESDDADSWIKKIAARCKVFEKRRHNKSLKGLIGDEDFDESSIRQLILSSSHSLSADVIKKCIRVGHECGIPEIDIILEQCAWACIDDSVSPMELREVFQHAKMYFESHAEKSLKSIVLHYPSVSGILKQKEHLLFLQYLVGYMGLDTAQLSYRIEIIDHLQKYDSEDSRQDIIKVLKSPIDTFQRIWFESGRKKEDILLLLELANVLLKILPTGNLFLGDITVIPSRFELLSDICVDYLSDLSQNYEWMFLEASEYDAIELHIFTLIPNLRLQALSEIMGNFCTGENSHIILTDFRISLLTESLRISDKYADSEEILKHTTSLRQMLSHVERISVLSKLSDPFSELNLPNEFVQDVDRMHQYSHSKMVALCLRVLISGASPYTLQLALSCFSSENSTSVITLPILYTQLFNTIMGLSSEYTNIFKKNVESSSSAIRRLLKILFQYKKIDQLVISDFDPVVIQQLEDTIEVLQEWMLEMSNSNESILQNTRSSLYELLQEFYGEIEADDVVHRLLHLNWCAIDDISFDTDSEKSNAFIRLLQDSTTESQFNALLQIIHAWYEQKRNIVVELFIEIEMKLIQLNDYDSLFSLRTLFYLKGYTLSNSDESRIIKLLRDQDIVLKLMLTSHTLHRQEAVSRIRNLSQYEIDLLDIQIIYLLIITKALHQVMNRENSLCIISVILKSSDLSKLQHLRLVRIAVSSLVDSGMHQEALTLLHEFFDFSKRLRGGILVGYVSLEQLTKRLDSVIDAIESKGSIGNAVGAESKSSWIFEYSCIISEE